MSRCSERRASEELDQAQARTQLEMAHSFGNVERLLSAAAAAIASKEAGQARERSILIREQQRKVILPKDASM